MACSNKFILFFSGCCSVMSLSELLLIDPPHLLRVLAMRCGVGDHYESWSTSVGWGERSSDGYVPHKGKRLNSMVPRHRKRGPIMTYTICESIIDQASYAKQAQEFSVPWQKREQEYHSSFNGYSATVAELQSLI